MCDNINMSVQPPKPLTAPTDYAPKVKSKKPAIKQRATEETVSTEEPSVGGKLHVQDLVKQYKINDISLDELSQAFIQDVQWDVRGITGNEVEGGNTWFVIYSAIDDKFTSEDFIKVAQDYEDADLKKSLGGK